VVDKSSIRDDPATAYLNWLIAGHEKVRRSILEEVIGVTGALPIQELVETVTIMERIFPLLHSFGNGLSIPFVAFEYVIKDRELILDTLNQADALLAKVVSEATTPTPKLEALTPQLRLRHERFSFILEAADLTHLQLQSHYTCVWALVYSLVDNDDSKVPVYFLALTELRDEFFIEASAAGFAKYMAVAAELAEDLKPLFASLEDDARADHCARMKSHVEDAFTELEVQAMLAYLNDERRVAHA
jgi:hypothetical protein